MQLHISISEVQSILRNHFNMSESDEIMIHHLNINEKSSSEKPDDFEYQEVPGLWRNTYPPDGFPAAGTVEVIRRDGTVLITDAIHETDSFCWMQDDYPSDYVKFRKVKD